MPSSPLAGVRILLVDDDELVREALHDYFVECGAVVVAAESARAALKAFIQAPPDVLVSDLRMPPGEDGILRSPSLPGLWLDPTALFDHDLRQLRKTLRQGTTTAEHKRWAASLRSAARAKTARRR